MKSKEQKHKEAIGRQAEYDEKTLREKWFASSGGTKESARLAELSEKYGRNVKLRTGDNGNYPAGYAKGQVIE